MLEPPANQLLALTTALEAAGLALTLARRVPAPLTSLDDHLGRRAPAGTAFVPDLTAYRVESLATDH